MSTKAASLSGALLSILGSKKGDGEVWIKVCNSQSEPDWSIKKAEPKLRPVFAETITSESYI
jgi:hypothetical protein